MQLKKLLSNDYVLSIFNKIFAVLTGIVTSSLTARYLGVELKGQYTYIMNIVNVVVVIANLGFYQSYPNQKRLNMDHQRQRYADVFVMQFLIYLAIAVVMACFSQDILYLFVFLLVPIQVLTNQIAMAALIEFITFRQLMQIAMSFLNLCLSILVFVFAPRALIFTILLMIAKDLFFCIAYLFKIRYTPHFKDIDWKFIKYLFTFGIFAVISEVLNTLNYRVGVLLMNPFVSYTEIGLYSVGNTLAEQCWMIPDAFKEVLFTKTAKSDSEKDVVFAIKLNILITVCFIIGIVVFGRLIIYILYGAAYIDAYQVTCLLFLGIPSMVLFKLISPLYVARGQQKFYFVIMLVSTVLNVVLSLILIPLFGKSGAALASVGSYSICGLFFYARFVKDFQIKWYEPLIIRKKDIRLIKKKVKHK